MAEPIKTHQELLAEYADCSIPQLKTLRSINQRSIQANYDRIENSPGEQFAGYREFVQSRIDTDTAEVKAISELLEQQEA